MKLTEETKRVVDEANNSRFHERKMHLLAERQVVLLDLIYQVLKSASEVPPRATMDV